MAVVAQHRNHGRRGWLSHSAASRMPSGDSETPTGSRLRKSGIPEIVRDRNAWRAGLPIRLHFLRSGRPGLGPSNLFADATPITGCIDARGYIGIDRQRRTMIDRGSDFRAGNDMPRSVVEIGTFNARGLGTSWHVRRRSGICAQKRIMGTVYTVTAFTFGAPAKLAPSG